MLGRSAVVLIAALVALVPGTPWSVGHGDVLMAMGQRTEALDWYRTVARLAPARTTSERAWRRAVLAARVDLGDRVLAQRLLEERLNHVEGRRARARVLAEMAELKRRMGDGEGAAATWMRAADEAPHAPELAAWLLARASILVELGREDEANAAFAELATRRPDARGRAWLGRARLAHARGDIHEALRCYDMAQELATDEAVASVARLGAAACLERLGEVDQALVMLEASDLPPAVHSVRTSGLRRRTSMLSP